MSGHVAYLLQQFSHEKIWHTCEEGESVGMCKTWKSENKSIACDAQIKKPSIRCTAVAEQVYHWNK